MIIIGYLAEVAGWNLLLFIIFRSISVIAGLLSYLIVKALDQTGVTKLFHLKRLRQPIREIKVLKAKNLRLKYPNGERKIFDNLNIEIKDKEKVLLLGPSGSGKSTLMF